MIRFALYAVVGLGGLVFIGMIWIGVAINRAISKAWGR